MSINALQIVRFYVSKVNVKSLIVSLGLEVKKLVLQLAFKDLGKIGEQKLQFVTSFEGCSNEVCLCSNEVCFQVSV
jgi:hypothetical protein